MSLQDRAPVSKVLVVEDDPSLLSFMADLLGDDGLEVACASRGAEALAILEGGLSPCVLVTDINLSGEPDGLALARAVAERWPQIRLLIVSGEFRPAHDQYPDQAIFFTKPFAGGALVSMIRSEDWRPDAAADAQAAPADARAPAKLPHEEVNVRLGLSKVHGIGVFAIRPIAAGTRIFPNESRPIRWVGVEELERSAPSDAARRFYEDFGIRQRRQDRLPAGFQRADPELVSERPARGRAKPMSAPNPTTPSAPPATSRRARNC